LRRHSTVSTAVRAPAPKRSTGWLLDRSVGSGVQGERTTIAHIVTVRTPSGTVPRPIAKPATRTSQAAPERRGMRRRQWFRRSAGVKYGARASVHAGAARTTRVDLRHVTFRCRGPGGRSSAHGRARRPGRDEAGERVLGRWTAEALRDGSATRRASRRRKQGSGAARAGHGFAGEVAR
jgi:hypothetical protein